MSFYQDKSGLKFLVLEWSSFNAFALFKFNTNNKLAKKNKLNNFCFELAKSLCES
jgi:hypothetical protein